MTQSVYAAVYFSFMVYRVFTITPGHFREECLRRNEVCFANEGMKRFAMKPPCLRADYCQNPPLADLIKALRTEKIQLSANLYIADNLPILTTRVKGRSFIPKCFRFTAFCFSISGTPIICGVWGRAPRKKAGSQGRALSRRRHTKSNSK